MPIQPSNPIIVPATEAVTYDSIWITSLNITALDTNQPVRCNVMVAPYNSTTGEINRSLQKPLFIQDLYAEAAIDPTIAAALQAIYAAVQNQITKNNIF